MRRRFCSDESNERVYKRVKSVAAIAFIAVAASFFIVCQKTSFAQGQFSDSSAVVPLPPPPPAQLSDSFPPVGSNAPAGYSGSIVKEGASVPTGVQTCAFQIVWTGPAHVWRGQVEIINPSNPSLPGMITEATSLGLEADQAAAYSVRQGVLYIHHPSSREYDGYNVTASGRPGSVVRITLAADNQPPKTFDVSWDALFSQPFQFNAFDSQVTIRRMSGDYLRLELDRDNLVYSPGENFSARLTPYELARGVLTSYNPATIKVRLQHSCENYEVYSKEYSWIPETGGDILLNIPLPQEEGVYDVIITASCRKVGAILPRVTGAVNRQLENAHLQSARELATRRVQLAVIDANHAPAEQTSPMETRLTAEIDPANPRWWEPFERLSQFSLGLRGKQWEYPLGSGNARIFQSELGPVTELAANRPGEEPSWEAYAFPVERMGIPHILEIEYPSDSPQTTGISIVEPNAVGAITTGNVDSGFNVTSDSFCSSDKPSWKTHKIIFWPKTKNPVVVIYNLREDVVSRYGKIRVMSVVGKLPKAYSIQSQRLLAAYLDRPQFPAMFSAKKTPTENGNAVVDSWETFYDGATRMIDYFNFVGYNGAMVSVNSDGSSIWPCSELAPTPRYDTGIFSQSCSDPVRKDVLEALMRMFDREKMRLIPAMEITQPILTLEARVRNSDPQTSGLQWIGPNGKTILSAYPPENGAAMYYNILHPEVQRVVLDAISHLVLRYKNHPCFTGFGLQLSDNSWLVLPPPQWGMDDETIRRFTAETGIAVPGEGAERFQIRARYLNGPAQEQWLKWRCAKLSDFYCQIRNRIQSDGINRKLYISGAKLFTRCHRTDLLPRIPQTVSVKSALMQCGLDSDFGIGVKKDIVLMYTQRVLNGQTLKESAAEREWNVLSDAGSFFGSQNGQRIQASLFYHPSHRIRLQGFEKKSPYKPTFAEFNCIPTPAGIENRNRFIQSLALWDTQEFFDGGWTFAFGEEESVTNTFAAFRCLANKPYYDAIRLGSALNPNLSGTAIQSQSQAIVCRWISDGRSTWVYAMNTTPYRIAGKIQINSIPSSDAGMTKLALDNVLHRFSESNNKGDACIENIPSLTTENGQLMWRSYFAPFETQVVRFNMPIRPSLPRVAWSQQTIDQIRQQLVELSRRVETLKTAKAMRILDNPDFEAPVMDSQPVPQWNVWKNLNQPENSVSGAYIDNSNAVRGKGSLHLVSDGWPTAVYSKGIAVDATGRFTVSVWIKKSPAIPLRCFIRANNHGKPLYREILWCQESPTAAVNQQNDWRQYYFHVNDLPLESMDDLCVGFELSHQGEVWIDDVNVSDLYFSEKEQRELYQYLAPLNAKFSQGELEYCWRFEKGYWSQFLMESVELGATLPSSPYAIAAPYNGAIGQNASKFNQQSATNAPARTQSASPPTTLNGTNQRKNLFRFGKNQDVSVPIPNQSVPAKEASADKEPEKKTMFQRVTDWFTWK